MFAASSSFGVPSPLGRHLEESLWETMWVAVTSRVAQKALCIPLVPTHFQGQGPRFQLSTGESSGQGAAWEGVELCPGLLSLFSLKEKRTKLLA